MKQPKPNIPDVLERFAAYQKQSGNGGWGALHIVLEDGNIQNSHVDWCIEYAQQQNDIEAEHLARILRTMSRAQRKRLPTKVDDFHRQEGSEFERRNFDRDRARDI